MLRTVGFAPVVVAASIGEVALRILVAAVLAMVTTSLSLRLVGVRRGWATALVSGAVGWVLGGAAWRIRSIRGRWVLRSSGGGTSPLRKEPTCRREHA